MSDGPQPETMDLRSIHEKLIDFLHSGKYRDADTFVKALADEQATEALTAILIAHIWWQQGDFIRARATIRAVDPETAPEDERTAILLLDASLTSIIDLKVKSSLAVANVLRDKGRVLMNCATAQDITRCEALSLIYYYRIRLTAAISGFDRHMDTLDEAWEEFHYLQRRFKHENRFDEELFLLKWTTARMINLPVQTRMEMLEDFIARVVASCQEPTASYLIGHAFFAAGSMLLKTRKMESFAQSPLERAVMRYKASNHGHGASEVAMYIATDASTLYSIADGFGKGLYYSGEVDALERVTKFVNAGGEAPSSSPDFLARLERSCRKYGMNLTLFLNYSGQLRRAVQKNSDIGATMSFWESFVSEIDLGEIGHVMAYNVCHSMFKAYQDIGDARNELRWAKTSYEISSACSYYEDRTKGVVDYAAALSKFAVLNGPREPMSDYIDRPKPKPIQKEGEPEDTRTEITQAIELLESWIMMDYMVGFKNGVGAQAKTVTLIGSYLTRWRLEGHKKGKGDLLAAEGLIETYTNTWGDDNRVKNLKIDLLRMSGDSATAIQLARLRLSQISNVDGLTDPEECHDATEAFEQLGTCLQERVLYELLPEGGKEELEEIISTTTRALALLHRTTPAEISFKILSLRVWALELLTNLYNEEARELYDDDTKETRMLEELVATINKEIQRTGALRKNLDIASQGSPAVFGRKVRNYHYTDLYLLDIGVRVLLELGRDEEAWRLLQNLKARAMTEYLGGYANLLDEFHTTTMPLSFSDTELHSLLKEESRLRTIAEQAESTEAAVDSKELERLRSKLRDNPTMSKLTALSKSDFDKDAQQIHSGGNIVYADWHISNKGPRSDRLTRGENWSYSPDESSLVLFLRKGSTLLVRHLSITRAEIETWKKDNLPFSSDREPELARLCALVEPIKDIAEPEDLLVLCPSRTLQDIPLHAVPVDESLPLIERNTVVYAMSTTSFHHCCLQSDRVEKLKDDKPPQLFEVQPEGQAEDDSGESTNSTTMASWVSEIKGDLVKGIEATLDRFRSASESFTWVHYHGWARPNKNSPLLSSIEFSVSQEEWNTLDDDRKGAFKSSSLTAQDILGLRLTYSPTFVVMNCGSTAGLIQDHAKGNMNITAALLLGGASSVLGNIWPTTDSCVRIFSAALYENIKSQDEDRKLAKSTSTLKLDDSKTESDTAHETSDRTIDLAKAYRAAVRRLRTGEDTNSPFYWAPFVVYGSPRVRI